MGDPLGKLLDAIRTGAVLASIGAAGCSSVGTPLRKPIVERMREELSRLRSVSAPAEEADLSAHGVLSPRQRWDTQRVAIGELLEPAVAALSLG